MAFFIPASQICETQEVNFFTSGNYATNSFSATWETRNIPDVEGLSVVYLDVLDKFDITVDSVNGLPPAGTLPGIDIHNMDAIQAIRLSMAEALTVGQWWEIYEDVNGAVYFTNVFNQGSPGKTVSLNVRLCIPSVSKSNEVDMVIVRGYDAPPVVETRDFRNVVPAGTGTINPVNVSGNEEVFTVAPGLLTGTCHQQQLKTTVYKSYKDPVFADVFSPQEPNPFYDVKAFERVIGYIHRITGMPGDPGAAALVNYSFHEDSTIWYKPIDFPSFGQVSLPKLSSDCPGFITGGIEYFEGEVNVNTPTFIDKYGFFWPLVKNPVSITYSGHKIHSLQSFGTGANEVVTMAVEPIKEVNELQSGSQWNYEISGPLSFNIIMTYSTPNPEFTNLVLSLAEDADSTVVALVNDGGNFSAIERAAQAPVFAGSPSSILPSPNSLGYLVDEVWIGLSLRRPSVEITAAFGDALEYAASLKIDYAPLVIIDEPAPIAYKHKDAGSVIVDQSVGLVDNDPTTCQNYEDRPVNVMNNLKTGNTIETTLPFCQDAQTCLAVAKTIFDYQNYTNAQTFTLTCGPDDEPELGAAVDGFDNNLRIESISYSYTDGSAYTIEVTLGPVFADIGSWNNGSWVRETEEVERDGIITWVAGDSINYRVYVQGLGEFSAINGTNTIFVSGEVVKVKVNNILKEA